MATFKRTRTSTATSTTTSTPASNAPQSAPASTPNDGGKLSGNQMTALQTALGSLVELCTKLNEANVALTGRVTKLENLVSELQSKLDAAIEAANECDEEDEEVESDEDDDEDGDDVTPDQIDCKKTFDAILSTEPEQQKAILIEAMHNLGLKDLKVRTVRKDEKVALAVAEVMCSEKFGWEVDDFLKDEFLED